MGQTDAIKLLNEYKVITASQHFAFVFQNDLLLVPDEDDDFDEIEAGINQTQHKRNEM